MENLIYLRKCDNCNKGMNKGYFDNYEYYCSDKCLLDGNRKVNPRYTMENWDIDCEKCPDDCYWTEWEDLTDGEPIYTKEGVEYYPLSDTDKVVTKENIALIIESIQFHIEDIEYGLRKLYFNKEEIELNEIKKIELKNLLDKLQ